MWRRWLLCGGLLGLSSIAGAQDPPVVVEPAEPIEERRYGIAAAAVDLSVMGAGVALFIREEEGVSGPLSEHASVGIGLTLGTTLLGGALTHAVVGRPDVSRQSVGLRAKSMGIGAVFGLGIGISAGTRLTLVCGLAGGGFCPLAYMYGLVFGPTIGATVGLGYGMVQDYRTLARRPIKQSKATSIHLQPLLGMAPDGRVQLGLAGAF